MPRDESQTCTRRSEEKLEGGVRPSAWATVSAVGTVEVRRKSLNEVEDGMRDRGRREMFTTTVGKLRKMKICGKRKTGSGENTECVATDAREKPRRLRNNVDY